MACKSKRDITGLYNLKGSSYDIIKLNSDSTFQFEKFNLNNFDLETFQPKKEREPHRFAASGVWSRIGTDSILLNSVNTITDTSYYWTVIKQPNSTGNFKFTFKSLSGVNVGIFQISRDPDFKNFIATRFHGGFESFEMEPERFDTLYFNDGNQSLLYPIWRFVKGSNLPAHYVMTLKPPHVNSYFKSKVVPIKNNKIEFSKDSVYKKFTPSR
ncbi:hypothetical protein LT679_17740 [Mucilaginibacter roseus]|uniref:Uncharacterized protein n=1 Tax=Mucilaginibacter roseus TaxID=1528868 RepID=A0ABS8U8W7_9SPHI|nr:hypothetical protein [Mucilaginibacter roseus]MCD8742457.1 hypothetical protein [Mucilaginibacter roseus]